jgi:hypothetical protein
MIGAMMGGQGHAGGPGSSKTAMASGLIGALAGSKTQGQGYGGQQAVMGGLAATAASAYLSDHQRKRAAKKAGQQGVSVDHYLQSKHGNKAAKYGMTLVGYMAQRQAKKANNPYKQKKQKKQKKNKGGHSSSSSSSSSSDSD